MPLQNDVQLMPIRTKCVPTLIAAGWRNGSPRSTTRVMTQPPTRFITHVPTHSRAIDTVLARPADPFVAELVGADDMVRRLGLVRVDRVMAPLPPGFHADSLPAIGATDDVRHALSLLLRTGARTLVVREGDAPVGTLALEQILDAARVGAPA